MQDVPTGNIFMNINIPDYVFFLFLLTSLSELIKLIVSSFAIELKSLFFTKRSSLLYAICSAALILPTCVEFSAAPPGRYTPKVPAASPITYSPLTELSRRFAILSGFAKKQAKLVWRLQGIS